jgi:molybdopterin molybdotransferase
MNGSTAKKSPRDMLGRAGVPLLSEALEILNNNLGQCPVCDKERASLESALHRVLAEDVLAAEDIPQYPRSTMDGYAVRAKETFGASESLPAYLEISGEVQMGEFPEAGPGPESCFKIATGGLLPPNTNAVVMFEHTVVIDSRMLEVLKPVAVGDNVIQKGDDVKKGVVVLKEGHTLKPQDVGLLAGLGISTVAVREKVKVGIFSTGDEVIPYDQTPEPGKIRDMNCVNLAALVAANGAVPQFYGIVRDEEEQFLAVVRKAIAENDVVLFSGSSSVGSRDLGERVVEKLGKPGVILHGVAIKPGKPVIISFVQDTAVFGLPGHPVSAAVAFDLFVKPTICHCAGQTRSSLPDSRTVKGVCMRNTNSAAGRTDFIQVELQPNDSDSFKAYPVLGKSGALSTMVKADGYFIIQDSCQGIEMGAEVDVHLY